MRFLRHTHKIEDTKPFKVNQKYIKDESHIN